MKRLARFDFAGVIHTDPARTDGLLAQRTPEGFLRITGRIMRSGTLEYSDGENTWLELRPVDEVKSSLDSFKLVVLTNDHPEDMVNAGNVRDVQVGHLGSDVKFVITNDGVDVLADILITDQKTIVDVLAGKRELSVGFTAEVHTEEGTTANGDRYDAVQRNIRGNHVAIVDVGRAGPRYRLLLERGDGAALHIPANTRPTMETVDIILGGETFTVPVAVAEMLTAQETELAELRAATEPAPAPEPAAGEPAAAPAGDAEGEGEEEPAAASDSVTALRAALAKSEARGDALEIKVTKLADGEGTRISARVSLIADASRILTADAESPAAARAIAKKLAGYSDSAIRKAVILAVRGDSFKSRIEGRDASFIEATFEHAVEAFDERHDSSGELDDLITTGRRSSASDSLDDDVASILDARDARHNRRTTA